VFKRVSLIALLVIGGAGILPIRAQAVEATKAEVPIPATRFYPISVGNRWEISFKRVTSLSMIPISGDPQNISPKMEGTQTVEIVREDSERSGENGKVYVQKTIEVSKPTDDSAEDDQPVGEPKSRLIGETYFRVNNRGIWLVADGEPNDNGDAIEKVTDRQLPLLWVPTDLKPDKSWYITCQVDTTITARITSRVGKPQTLRVNGETYQNCLPVVSIADRMSGRLDLGVGLAPIREGRVIDITWYAPGVGAVRSHQLANFDLEPPNANFSGVKARFEETQEILPGYKIN
jgi:hypothetical protein